MTDVYNMISKDKQYRTRDGREVRIYSTDTEHKFDGVHGATKEIHGWELTAWGRNGMKDISGIQHSRSDLIEVKPRIKRTYFVNLYNPPEGESILYLRHEQAMANRKDGWVGCAKIKIDIEEGEQQV